MYSNIIVPENNDKYITDNSISAQEMASFILCRERNTLEQDETLDRLSIYVEEDTCLGRCMCYLTSRDMQVINEKQEENSILAGLVPALEYADRGWLGYSVDGETDDEDRQFYQEREEEVTGKGTNASVISVGLDPEPYSYMPPIPAERHKIGYKEVRTISCNDHTGHSDTCIATEQNSRYSERRDKPNIESPFTSHSPCTGASATCISQAQNEALLEAMLAREDREYGCDVSPVAPNPIAGAQQPIYRLGSVDNRNYEDSVGRDSYKRQSGYATVQQEQQLSDVVYPDGVCHDYSNTSYQSSGCESDENTSSVKYIDNEFDDEELSSFSNEDCCDEEIESNQMEDNFDDTSLCTPEDVSMRSSYSCQSMECQMCSSLSQSRISDEIAYSLEAASPTGIAEEAQSLQVGETDLANYHTNGISDSGKKRMSLVEEKYECGCTYDSSPRPSPRPSPTVHHNNEIRDIKSQKDHSSSGKILRSKLAEIENSSNLLVSENCSRSQSISMHGSPLVRPAVVRGSQAESSCGSVRYTPSPCRIRPKGSPSASDVIHRSSQLYQSPIRGSGAERGQIQGDIKSPFDRLRSYWTAVVGRESSSIRRENGAVKHRSPSAIINKSANASSSISSTNTEMSGSKTPINARYNSLNRCNPMLDKMRDILRVNTEIFITSPTKVKLSHLEGICENEEKKKQHDNHMPHSDTTYSSISIKCNQECVNEINNSNKLNNNYKRGNVAKYLNIDGRLMISSSMSKEQISPVQRNAQSHVPTTTTSNNIQRNTSHYITTISNKSTNFRAVKPRKQERVNDESTRRVISANHELPAHSTVVRTPSKISMTKVIIPLQKRIIERHREELMEKSKMKIRAMAAAAGLLLRDGDSTFHSTTVL